MKITSEPITEQTKNKYPYHGKHKIINMIVEFYAPKSGEVAWSGENRYKEGYISDTWVEREFTPITYKTTFEG